MLYVNKCQKNSLTICYAKKESKKGRGRVSVEYLNQFTLPTLYCEVMEELMNSEPNNVIIESISQLRH